MFTHKLVGGLAAATLAVGGALVASPASAASTPFGPLVVPDMGQAEYDAWYTTWVEPWLGEGPIGTPPPYADPAYVWCADPAAGVVPDDEARFVPVGGWVPPVMHVYQATGLGTTSIPVVDTSCAQAWGAEAFDVGDVGELTSPDGRNAEITMDGGTGYGGGGYVALPGGVGARVKVSTNPDYAAIQDQVVRVPVGETASADLLRGASWFRGVLPAGDPATLTVAVDTSAVEDDLSPVVDGATLTVTPASVGTWAVPFTATTPSGHVTAAEVRVVATELALPDQQVEVEVGQTAQIDLFDGIVSTWPADDLIVAASAVEGADALISGTGWVRTGHRATITPTVAGTWHVAVSAGAPDGSVWADATLTIVATDPAPVVVPEPVEPEPETPVVDEPVEPVVPAAPPAEPETPAVVLPPVGDKPPVPQAPEEPVVPIFATGLPDATGTSPLRGVGLGLVVAGLGVGAVAVARRGRAER